MMNLATFVVGAEDQLGNDSRVSETIVDIALSHYRQGKRVAIWSQADRILKVKMLELGCHVVAHEEEDDGWYQISAGDQKGLIVYNGVYEEEFTAKLQSFGDPNLIVIDLDGAKWDLAVNSLSRAPVLFGAALEEDTIVLQGTALDRQTIDKILLLSEDPDNFPIPTPTYHPAYSFKLVSNFPQFWRDRDVVYAEPVELKPADFAKIYDKLREVGFPDGKISLAYEDRSSGKLIIFGCSTDGMLELVRMVILTKGNFIVR